MGNKARFDEMSDFFAGVGEGHAAGIWQDVPTRPPGIPQEVHTQAAKRPQDAGPARTEEMH